MEFAILGPVEVSRDGEPVVLGGPKQRALLAILLLHANQVVSRDRLIEDLWGEHPPTATRRTLETYVSRLRSSLGTDRIVQRAGGYELRIGADELDLDRFEHRVAARDYAGALALWRGPALADVLFEPFAAAEAARLEERRLGVLEERLEAEIAAGEGTSLVPELERLVREHPLRERLLGQLMLALYRAGRHATALETYRAARRRLSEDLGLEPGPQLRELERRILAHDPGLLFAARVDVPAVRRRRSGGLVIAAATAVAAAGVAAGLVAETRGGGAVAHASGKSSRLVAIAGRSGVVSGVVELPTSPASLAAAGSLWLADPGDGLVVRADPAGGAVVDRIPVGGQPASIVAGGGSIWVAGTVGRSLARIDPATGTVTQTIHLAGGATPALAYGFGGLWVADELDQALVEVGPVTGSPERTISLDLEPTSLAVGDGAIWVGDANEAEVVEVDPSSGQTLQAIPVGNGPTALALGGGELWVANGLDSTVSAIDTATARVIATIPVGSGPTSLVYARGSVWVANQYSGTVSRVDPKRNVVTQTIPVGGQPIAIAARGNDVWVGAAPAAAAHRGGTLRLVYSSPIPIDPAIQFTSNFEFSRFTYDSLVTYAAAPGPAGLQLVPDLAVALPVPSAGGTVYTFRLRKGVRYSDGRPLRASDFRRAIERQFRVGGPVTDYFRGIVGARRCSSLRCDLGRGIRADDVRGIVSFRLVAPDPDFLPKLTVEGFSAPVPPGVPNHVVASDPVPGTGPYRIASANSREVRFVRNPYFAEWSHAAQPDGNPDVVVWRFTGSVEAATRAVEAGKADWSFSLPASALPRLRIATPALLRENPGFSVEFLAINTHRAPFDDLRVRQALNYAIDRGLITRMYGGESVATPLCQPLAPGLPGFRRYCPYTADPRGGGAWSAPDPAKARQLVAASGTRGESVTLWASPDEGVIPPAVPRYVAGLLRSLGYRTTLRLVPHASITQAKWRDMQISVEGDWLPDFPTPSSYIPAFFGCDGSLSNGYVCDPQLDRQMRQANQLQRRDPQQAALLWAHVDHEITDRAYWVPTVNVGTAELVSRRIGNYELQPVGGFIADQAWVR